MAFDKNFEYGQELEGVLAKDRDEFIQEMASIAKRLLPSGTVFEILLSDFFLEDDLTVTHTITWHYGPNFPQEVFKPEKPIYLPDRGYWLVERVLT